MEKLSKDMETRIVELRGKHFSFLEILNIVGTTNAEGVAEVLNRDMYAAIESFRNVPKNSPKYREVFVNAVRLLRTEYNMNYKQIAEALGESEYVVFDIIRRNPVSLGVNGYVKSSFTREEKRMRNRDMIRLNKSGKTLSEIGRIYFCSKQIISRIFKDIEYEPISEQAALSVGQEQPSKSADELIAESKINDLKKEITDVKRSASIAKYQLHQQILDLRLGYIQALMQNIAYGEPSEDTVKQYKTLRSTLKRTYNALVQAGGEETKEVEKLTDIMPKLAETDKLVK